MAEVNTPQSNRSGFRPAPLGEGLAWYVAAVIPVLAAVWIGRESLERRVNLGAPRLIDSMASWDGRLYAEIADRGYRYDRAEASNVAFFPAYPLLSRWVSQASGLDATAALLLVTHVCLAAALIVLRAYFSERGDAVSARWMMLAMIAWPATLFWRMAYGESLFVLVLVVALLGMRRGWPALPLAMLVGFGTAVRPTGVALAAVFVCWLWNRQLVRDVIPNSHAPRELPWRRAVPLVGFGLLSFWGIAAYSGWLWWEFGDSLAFLRTQTLWAFRPASANEEFRALLTCEPLWSVYVPSSPNWWGRYAANPWETLQFADPILFCGVAALLAYGCFGRILNRYEGLLGGLLLLIPYSTHAFRTGMTAQGRYAAVAFPAYLVAGELAARAPRVASIAFVLGMIVLLGWYSALFGAWYRVI